MAETIVIPGAAFDDLEPMPIDPARIRRGNPVARGRLLTDTPDRLAYIMAWECMPGEFAWHYAIEEETVYFLDGEVFVSIDGAPERRLGAGDLVVFTRGSSTVWRITHTVRKIAILRKHTPFPLGLATRAWNKLRRRAAAFSSHAGTAQPSGSLVRS